MLTFDLKGRTRGSISSRRDGMRKSRSRYFLPRSLNILNLGLSSKLSLRSDLTRDEDDFGSEDGERVNHAVDRVDEVEHLSLHGDSDDLDGEISSSLYKESGKELGLKEGEGGKDGKDVRRRSKEAVR